jgi:hypothetical protein
MSGDTSHGAICVFCPPELVLSCWQKFLLSSGASHRQARHRSSSAWCKAERRHQPAQLSRSYALHQTPERYNCRSGKQQAGKTPWGKQASNKEKHGSDLAPKPCISV